MISAKSLQTDIFVALTRFGRDLLAYLESKLQNDEICTEAIMAEQTVIDKMLFSPSNESSFACFDVRSSNRLRCELDRVPDSKRSPYDQR